MCGAVRRAVVDLDACGRPEKRARPRCQLTPFGRQIARIDAVEARDVRVALCFSSDQSLSPAFDVEAVIRRVAEGSAMLRGIPHDLLRHAADVDAGAAQAVRFDHRGLGAVLGRALRAGESAAAAADDDQIEDLHRTL